MTHKAALLIALSLFASSPALAGDSRIQTIRYDAEEIVSIVGHAGIQSTIQFGLDERIENIAVGDSSAWQVTPNRRGSLLFIKPLSYASRTNMTVVTDKRTYMFDLRSGGKAGQPLYSLKFSYPDLPPVIAAPADLTGVVMAAGPAPAATVPSAERLNFEWKVKGSSEVRPGRIFDDGTSLFLSWAQNVQLPAILTSTENGREAPLDYRIAGDYIVLSPVPQNIVLRHGKNAATAWTTTRMRAPSAAAARPEPVQQTRPIVPDDRIAIRTIYASRIPEAPTAPSGGRTNIKTAGAADLLSDNLTGGQHDH